MGIHAKKIDRFIDIPEILFGFAACGTALLSECFMLQDGTTSTLLCIWIALYTLCVLIRTGEMIFTPQRRSESLVGRQLIVACAACVIIPCCLKWGVLPPHMYPVGELCVWLIGILSLFKLIGKISKRGRRKPGAASGGYRAPVLFFAVMAVFVLISTLLLMTPGAHEKPISFIDAFFMCASATSITGLTTFDISSTLTAFGKIIVLLDIQVGAIGVMTFTYAVLMVIGRNLDTQESSAVSSIFDQEGVQSVPVLLRTILCVTLGIETFGAILLYRQWQGVPAVPGEGPQLLFYAAFHSVSAFCNSGITLFPNGMAEPGIAQCRSAQVTMAVLMLAGTLGFGIYREGMSRLRRRFSGRKNYRRWSTHSWFVIRVTVIVLLIGFAGLSLLTYAAEPSHAHLPGHAVSESLWNTIGRSAGFNLTDMGLHGSAYKLFMCFLMFVGGNPAGTGGGVYAPVVALCVLEVIRVLRGQQDVQFHSRRVARGTVERAMATVVLSIFWIFATTMLLLLLEPTESGKAGGFLNMLFLETSAYTTTGYTLISPAGLCDVSKVLISLNMLFGRVGMFTFMLIFIRPAPPQPFRYPETRLPLN